MRLSLLAFCAVASLSAVAQDRPNILISVADDLGYVDLGRRPTAGREPERLQSMLDLRHTGRKGLGILLPERF